MKTRIRRGVSIVLILCVVQGCGVYMAYHQPEAVKTDLLVPGKTRRALVMAECGSPVSTHRTDDGKRVDTYHFYEGSSQRDREMRGSFHLFADLVTLGLWELVATPMELGIRGDQYVADAIFDQNDVLLAFTARPMEKVEEETW